MRKNNGNITEEWCKEHYNITDEQIARRKLFLSELSALCRKHNVSIGHEDGHGAFELLDFDETLMEWLCDADSGVYED